jgi:hypothetical protein
VATSSTPVASQYLCDNGLVDGRDLKSLHTSLDIFICARVGEVQHFVDIRPPKKILRVFVARAQRSIHDHLSAKHCRCVLVPKNHLLPCTRSGRHFDTSVRILVIPV